MKIEADGNVRGVTPVEFRVMPRALQFVVKEEKRWGKPSHFPFIFLIVPVYRILRSISYREVARSEPESDQ